MEKLKDEMLLKKILLIFLAIQPILDCYLLYTDEVIKFFHFSPTTIIRLLVIAFLFILIFINKNYKQNRKLVYIYGGIIIFYTVLHHLVASGYSNEGYKTFNYDFVTEMFYIMRMLFPMCIIYITYSLKPTKEEIIRLFLIVSMITSFVIVGSNLIIFSLASYGGGVIRGNIFTWFFNSGNIPAYDLAGKGWFNSANQISGLMFILFPICIYSLFEKLNKSRIIITSLVLLSMMILGTRVASYGWILLFVMMIIIYVICSFLFKTIDFDKRKFGTIILILLFGSLIMTHAPLVNTSSTYKDEDKDSLKQLKEEKVNTKKMLKYIGMNGLYYKRIYPYEEHKKFWEYVVYKVPETDRVGNRNSERLITLDVADTYGTGATNFFGLGYSRFISAYLYWEKDFVVQYYTVGIIGILLFLCPYILIALYAFIVMLKNKKISPFILVLLMMLVLPLGVSYFSGHIVDELIVSLYLAFIAGALLCYSRKVVVYDKS